MVTDEDRDYMYRVYAGDPRARINLGIRRRLAPLLDNDRRRVELMNALLFSLPGTPVVYYGDEIGMGDNFYLGDRNGVRTPMQWSSDRNAGFSRANPQQLFLPVIVDPEYHYEAVNVAAQEQNPHSLLWWMRRLIAQRKRRPAFSRGTLEFLYPHNHRVLAFVRRFEDERILVVANLSRFAQHVELDVAGSAPDLVGASPVELFGRTPFPRIGELPYLLTLGPHGFDWFSLERDRGELTQRPIQQIDEAAPPLLEVAAGWEELVDTGSGRRRLEAELPAILRSRRWLAERSRTPREASIVHRLPLRDTGSGLDARLLAVRTEVQEGEAETYLLPVAFAGGERGRRLAHEQPWAVLARVESVRGDSGVLFDAVHDHAFCHALLAAVAGKKRLREDGAELAGLRAAGFEPPADLDAMQPFLPGGGRPNTTVYFDQRLVLKLYRRIEPGIHPEVELGRFLTERAGFPHTPPLAGWLELRS
jgi:maltose alpha-D-glucosyltransferase/alpha-amylase